MGLFSRQESVFSGQLVLRIELADPSGVQFTLDESETGRVWQSGMIRLQPAEGINSPDDAVREATKRGLAYVRETIPSLEQPHLQIRIDDKAPGGPDLVCSGSVRYLKSEWDNYKRATIGRTWQ